MSKTHWVMFIFGFLLDKINLFPFILGLFLGIYLSKNTSMSVDISKFSIIYDYFKEYINAFIENKDEVTEIFSKNSKDVSNKNID